MAKGRITIDIENSAEAKVTFEGEIDGSDIQSVIYHIRTCFYTDYISRIASEERIGIVAKQKRLKEEKVIADKLAAEKAEKLALALAKEEKNQKKVRELAEATRKQEIVAANQKLDAARRAKITGSVEARFKAEGLIEEKKDDSRKENSNSPDDRPDHSRAEGPRQASNSSSGSGVTSTPAPSGEGSSKEN